MVWAYRSNQTNGDCQVFESGHVVKKFILILLALCVVSSPALAGMTAFMDMDELTDEDLDKATGEAGITMLVTPLSVTSGYIGWGDDDGLTNTVNPTNQGWLTLHSVWGDATITPILVDVQSDGANSWVTIGALTVDGNVGIKATKIGNTPDGGNDTGEFRATGLHVETSPIKVCGH